MNKSKKKILSFVLALSMMLVVLSGFTTTANAATTASSTTKVSDTTTIYFDCGLVMDVKITFKLIESDNVYTYYSDSHKVTNRPSKLELVSIHREKVAENCISFNIKVVGKDYTEIQTWWAYCSQSGDIEWIQQ